MIARRPMTSPIRPAIKAPTKPPMAAAGGQQADLLIGELPLRLENRQHKGDYCRIHCIEHVSQPTDEKESSVESKEGMRSNRAEGGGQLGNSPWRVQAQQYDLRSAVH